MCANAQLTLQTNFWRCRVRHVSMLLVFPEDLGGEGFRRAGFRVPVGVR